MQIKQNIIERLLPQGAFPFVERFLQWNSVDIKVVKGRSTKFADFNPRDKTRKTPLVTINNNMNPFSFFITLLHEFAHYLVWKDGKLYAKPHGLTWKKHFSSLMQAAIDEGIFPEHLLPQLNEHIQDPRATSCTDTQLFRKLSLFDAEKAGVFIEDIPDGQCFLTNNGKQFRREKKVRKRILCIHQETRKKYLFSPICQVFPIKGQQYVLVFS